MSIPVNTRPLTGSPPALKAPAGATDCHVHLYLPGYEAQPGGPKIPELATVVDYQKLQKWLSLERVVVTQPNAYQFDNRAILQGVAEIGQERARAIVAVAPDASESEIEAMHIQGARGARIMQLPGGAVGIAGLAAVEERIRAFGWHLMVQFNGHEIDDYMATLKAIKTDYIIDHIGKFMPPVAADDARVDQILSLLDRGNAWIKICGGYEASLSGGPEYDDVGPIAKRLIQHAPDRVIWGSNWPHVGVPREQYPDDAEQLDVLLHWADEDTRKKILVDNPAALYGF
ncbi:amidohydrolase family protein [Halomonas sp. ISL-60]|uniref:amidohydrolase family protein n=1 Tax=Halomonas sp. ISL-56 TaxID=2819149 RepID=UPI001BED3287|nr:amidohydrolase family protein [Halomonas sp. ISL-56]MBT2770991.1 amidohydrolase family protein [Halomonas sp. ISL-60]MBT2802765.1 amidohydrolase family protein [Halomonas sp. ISL-56]